MSKTATTVAMKGAAILSVKALPNVGPMPTLDPFLFCVYHRDDYPAAINQRMEAPAIGNGSDFNPNVPYRMYHGDRIPGFPQHPHRGFETVTATMDGIIDHADSVGNAGRYGLGDLQWMTAGKGVVHSEMFPLIHQDRENPLRLYQIWLNLPKRNKMVEPGFAMFWNTSIPKWSPEEEEEKLVTVTLWAGEGYFGVTKNPNLPPSDSWASDISNDVVIFRIELKPGGKFTLPKARTGTDVNRVLYYVEGESGVLSIDGKVVDSRVFVQIKPDQDVEIELASTSTTDAAEVLLLQGKPIGEPVAQHGPFVMNTRDEIQQAFMDYSRTQFGGWPWERDDMVFPPDKARFAKLHGQETYPSSSEEGQCKATTTTDE